MNSHGFSSSPFLPLVCFLLVIFAKIKSSSSNPNYLDESCNIEFKCGSITVGYPFWGGPLRPWGCGHPQLELNCEGEGHLDTTMKINEVKYRVLDINLKDETLKIARMDYWQREGICSPVSHNTTINDEIFDYSDGYDNVTFLYDCPSYDGVLSPCSSKEGVQHYKNWSIKAGDHGPGICNASVFFPVPINLLPREGADPWDFRPVLDIGFELKWKLGTCAWDQFNNTICFCPNQQHGLYHACPGSSFSKRRMLILALGIAAGVVGILIILLLIIGRIIILHEVVTFSENKTENCLNMEAFVRNFGSLAPTRYNYSDVKKMTESFSNRLGQGGYGDVYKGKLPDDRLVAVKFLKESKGNGEEFTNEVASISRTSHVNIVNLLGFCYERNKRALIYEFMPNGSLDKFIYDQESSTTKSSLEWKTMFQIAVGIARGLEYLHRGCNTRIVHFDIKPHNILLDEDFCPKISDFGLAKLCKKKESIVSMLGARGTIGYIAPEIVCRTFGEVSHKSDVYSYGMMILEMVGGRKNIDVRVSHTSEIYFPNWIYKQLEPSNDFELHGAIIEEEKELAKKMVLVSLWCIQTIPLDRPSMTRVVEMLEGGFECLQVPPKPSLASQTRSPQHFSTIASSSSAA